MPVVMGTAGHIDHGKTTLIKALTGIDCDRLSEEKKRGITIELGFAFLDFDDSTRLSVVDVPGHERFVKNMVAGAAGIDFVLLVIAADEGIMPQTREHLEICSLLGIETGIVALTKTDMVDEEWLEMVKEEVAAYLEPTFLGGAPIMPVSAHTGQGLGELKAELKRLMDEFKPKRRSDLARLPVDRVFTMKGHGTVVTGTLISGSFRVGDDVVLFPKGTETKVRGLQSHGATVEEAPAGRRTAVNLQGLEVQDISRGEILARPGTMFPATVWDIELSMLESSPLPLKHRKEVHFHHGSREVQARIHFLDREKLLPGEKCVCQVRFNEPLAGVYGDRIVLRSFSPLRTIAGGRIISPMGHKIKRFSDRVQALETLSADDSDAVILQQLDLAGSAGVSFAELMIMSNLESKALDKALTGMAGKQMALMFDKEDRRFVSGALVQTLCDGLLEYLAEFHRRDSMKPGVQRGELASAWGRELPPKLFHLVLERMVKKGDVVGEQEILRLKDHKVSLASDTARVREIILGAYEQGGIRPPNLKDVLEPTRMNFKEAAPVFRHLQDEGLLTKIKEDMYYHTPALEDIRSRIIAFFETSEEMGAQDFKGLTDLSRKFAIPVLEYFDKERLTVRVGDVRRLRKSGV
ncbi:selenocysteine-specific translation elongation factor [Salidesulfovibrio onnuriiensis]|uniref:selenocysteine-specific translation elongation factor n=1 Tax=Salidesulfovibrio onnuriiensis TaxID=2583823 RepID=UPI0011C86756|nr:selenocysteine-specific translation elongation factor [Salidesulfovibrio onnuriiensis]